MVRWAYRLLLDRDPQKGKELAEKLRQNPSAPEIRRELLMSDEFKWKNPELTGPTLSGNEPPMEIERVDSDETMRALFDRIQQSWTHMGETEPHWSVLPAEEFKQSNIGDSEEAFYEKGRRDTEWLFRTLARCGIEADRLRSCLEYGCGVARVTRWLAERFETVHGFDISKAHLEIARRHLESNDIGNVTLHHVRSASDLAALPRVDLVYSIIVLQHNPPPIICAVIRSFLRALNPGGVAVFQVPTYREGYRFSVEKYLSTEASKDSGEMHVFPQREIFGIVRQEGATPVEVLEDDWTGAGYRKEISNTFVIRRD